MAVIPSPPRCPGHPLCDRDHRGGVPGAALHSLLHVCQLPQQQAQVGGTSGKGGCLEGDKTSVSSIPCSAGLLGMWCRGQLMHSLDLWVDKEYI